MRLRLMMIGVLNINENTKFHIRAKQRICIHIIVLYLVNQNYPAYYQY